MDTHDLENELGFLGGHRRIRYELDGFRNALSHIGNPEKNVHSLVIAGTNGKGGTSLLISSALAMAGNRVGTYLSPHLQSVRERFLFNLETISESEFLNLVHEYTAVAKQFDLTYFEFLTLIYFVWAKNRNFDFSVLEVGLGGRLDATNVTDPIACAITSIDWDHEAILGDSLQKILEEKMGILRRESLVFTGMTQPELLEHLEKYCFELDTIYYHARELRTELIERDWGGQKLSINGYPFFLNNPSQGSLKNASTAFLLLRIVFPKIPMQILQDAFRRVITPGRMECVSDSPRIILTGDHNPSGIECLTETLCSLPKSHTHVVCAFSADKPFRKMYERLSSISKSIHLTTIPGAELPQSYFEFAPVTLNPNEAIDQALAAMKPEDTLVITGSLYLIGKVRQRWRPPTTIFCRS